MPEIPLEFSPVELWILAAFHVPPYPQPPEGSPDSIQVFQAGRNYYTLCVLKWLFSHLAILAGLIGAHFIVALSSSEMPEWGRLAWRILQSFAFSGFVVSAVVTFLSQRLNYSLRWYIVTDRSLRIRSGIFAMQELTMTFSNIQEIRVSAGPLQNFLKLADVEVHSAGGGSDNKGGGGHIGRFSGVSNANDIRDLLTERLRQYRDSGLGDAAPDQTLEAARTVLAEARALRSSLCQ